MAASDSVKTFAAAQIFYSAGGTGIQILQQIFIADTSDLLNRALWSSLPDVPFLITVWVGAPLASDLLSHTTWRWGYGVWTMVLPVSFLPLALALFLNTRKAKKLGRLHPSPWAGQSFSTGAKNLWYELDIMGLLLLSAASALILIPCTLAQRARDGWNNGSMIAMVVIGALCLVAFPLWESSSRLAPHPFIPPRLFKNRTVAAGCAIAFFYFGKLLTPKWTCLGVLMGTSRLLYLRAAIFLLVPSGGAESLDYCRRSYYPDLFVYRDRRFDHHRVGHQVFSSLQVFYHYWLRDLPPWNRTHDSLSEGRQLHRFDRWDPDRGRDRWRHAERTCSAWGSSLSEPRRCCGCDSGLFDHPGDRRCCGLGNIWLGLDIEYPQKIGNVPTTRSSGRRNLDIRQLDTSPILSDGWAGETSHQQVISGDDEHTPHHCRLLGYPALSLELGYEELQIGRGKDRRCSICF